MERLQRLLLVGTQVAIDTHLPPEPSFTGARSLQELISNAPIEALEALTRTSQIFIAQARAQPYTIIENLFNQALLCRLKRPMDEKPQPTSPKMHLDQYSPYILNIIFSQSVILIADNSTIPEEAELLMEHCYQHSPSVQLAAEPSTQYTATFYLKKNVVHRWITVRPREFPQLTVCFLAEPDKTRRIK